jgi:hypothetical protein
VSVSENNEGGIGLGVGGVGERKKDEKFIDAKNIPSHRWSVSISRRSWGGHAS